jgi:hypothetical protein
VLRLPQTGSDAGECAEGSNNVLPLIRLELLQMLIRAALFHPSLRLAMRQERHATIERLQVLVQFSEHSRKDGVKPLLVPA